MKIIALVLACLSACAQDVSGTEGEGKASWTSTGGRSAQTPQARPDDCEEVGDCETISVPSASCPDNAGEAQDVCDAFAEMQEELTGEGWACSQSGWQGTENGECEVFCTC